MLSNHKCRIILLLREGVITFENQKIYKNKLAFKRAMRELHDGGLVLTRRSNGSPNEYKLSEKGEYIASVLHEL